MSAKRFIAVRNENCLKCNFCYQYIDCALSRTGCIGCGACIKGCPQGAIQLEPRREPGSKIQFSLDGKPCTVMGPLSVRDALLELGPTSDNDPPLAKENNHILCSTGSCWSCGVLIDGRIAPSCITPLEEGMQIVTDPVAIDRVEPRRIVTLMRPAPHYHPSIFTHGCNYHCDLCHNWNLTFSNTGHALNPVETAARLNLNLEEDHWVGISGGEPTLNRKWLLETVRAIRQAAPDIRIQLDTNASVLIPEYIDELVESGITDISPDLKATRLKTFMKVCGLNSEKRAKRYLETSWQAVRYLNATYSDQVFMAVSVPCHPRTHSMDELEETAQTIASINPEIPVTLIEYQPAFRLRDWPFVSQKGMEQVRKIFETAGLHKVIIQGGQDIPRAVDPMDLALSSENF